MYTNCPFHSLVYESKHALGGSGESSAEPSGDCCWHFNWGSERREQDEDHVSGEPELSEVPHVSFSAPRQGAARWGEHLWWEGCLSNNGCRKTLPEHHDGGAISHGGGRTSHLGVISTTRLCSPPAPSTYRWPSPRIRDPGPLGFWWSRPVRLCYLSGARWWFPPHVSPPQRY